MVTGQRAFDGGSKAGTIAAILDREPAPLSVARRERVPGDDPPPTLLESIVTRCLAKNVDDRWQTAHDLHAALSLSLEADGAGSRPTAVGAPWWRRAAIGWTAAVLAGAALVGLAAAWSLDRRDIPNVRFLVPPPDGLTFNQSNAFMSLSPDGRALAFSAATALGAPALWIRSLDSTTPQQLPGTDGAVLPFWSADSRSIAFTSGDSLKTIEIATASHGSHAGSGSMASTSTPPALRLGGRGSRSRRQPSSPRSRSAFLELQTRHAATQFSQVCPPPRLRGTTWSMVSARRPQ